VAGVAILGGAAVVLACAGLLFGAAWAMLALGRWLDRLRYGKR
jgi:hypothetical protein